MAVPIKLYIFEVCVHLIRITAVQEAIITNVWKLAFIEAHYLCRYLYTVCLQLIGIRIKLWVFSSLKLMMF
jgi:hypothetical protein